MRYVQPFTLFAQNNYSMFFLETNLVSCFFWIWKVVGQVWYQDFVKDENLSREMLFDMLTAANFMGIKPLLDLTCLKVTFQLTGKNAEEVSVSSNPARSI